ncbi:MAG: proline--tRNA ligase, partial [Candidatus Bathyarchaeia archaeon]
LKAQIEERKIVKVNWCGDPDCAFRIKDEVAGEVRGTPWDGAEEAKGPCIICGGDARHVAIVARTF